MIETRLQNARKEIEYMSEYTYLIINDELEEGLKIMID